VQALLERLLPDILRGDLPPRTAGEMLAACYARVV
jgi:hypothetical protein